MIVTINSIYELTGAQIAKIREASGLSQRKFVAEVGISRGNLWRIESRKMQPNKKESARIANWAIRRGYAKQQTKTLWQKIKDLFK